MRGWGLLKVLGYTATKLYEFSMRASPLPLISLVSFPVSILRSFLSRPDHPHDSVNGAQSKRCYFDASLPPVRLITSLPFILPGEFLDDSVSRCGHFRTVYAAGFEERLSFICRRWFHCSCDKEG